MIVRNVKIEDLKAVSEIAVKGWQTAYRGIIDDEFLYSLSVEENYPSRAFYEKMGGVLYGESTIVKGGKEYKEVGYRYDLSSL